MFNKWNYRFISLAKEKHGNKFDYSNLNYKTMKDVTEFVCNIHGNFFTTPENHLKSKHGCCKHCRKSVNRSKLYTEEELLCLKNNMFSYPSYTPSSRTDIIKIRCKVHGDFKQKLLEHINSIYSCSGCEYDAKRLLFAWSREKFIEESKKRFPDLFIYDDVVYVNQNTAVWLICKKHGKFKCWPSTHLRKKKPVGCPSCSNNVSYRELEILDFISKNKYQAIHRFKPDWLKSPCKKGTKEIDIFIPELSLGIEYNGVVTHHSFTNIKCFKNRSKSISYHQDKYLKCLENGVNLIHIFEFEDFNKWKRKLKLYFNNPDKYEIGFKNNKRTYKRKDEIFSYYGQSYIEVKND